jgi:hypothetical protein
MGHLQGAIGLYMGKYIQDCSLSHLSLTVGGHPIFSNGRFVLDDMEQEFSQHIKDAEYGETANFPPYQKFVKIGVNFGNVGSDVDLTIMDSKLMPETIIINAGYQS